MTTRLTLLCLAAFIAIILLAGLLLPSPIDPVAYRPTPAPALDGVYHHNDALLAATRLAEGQVSGPEGITVGPDGAVYGGTDAGDIVRITASGALAAVEVIANTGGRPLGMAFDSEGYLIVADLPGGLLRVSLDGDIEPLVTEVDGIPLSFANDVAIAKDGTIYLTESSTRSDLNSGVMESLEARPWGRLIAYHPGANRAEVIADQLYFPNGITLSADNDYLLFNETFRYRVQRFWLQGERVGQLETFADNLPGFPDGISRSPRGGYWLTLVAPRSDLLDRLHPYPWAKTLLARIPESMVPEPPRFGFILALDTNGTVIANLQDPASERIFAASSVEEYDGHLYIGTLTGNWVGRYPLHNEPESQHAP
ncbi:MAG: SMP-30/gluconolactonase/LRE family protein [Marinobacter sp.]|nr:SMP-30/gluconolactonase/LRE family protein [Marinobacter sp.]